MGLKVKIVGGMMKLWGKLPLGFHYFCADIISWLAKNVLRYRRDEVFINLSRSFPEKKYGQIKKIANDFYTHFGEIIAETIWFGASDSERLKKSNICTITNPEILSDAFLNSPSVTVLMSHAGNWELLGGVFTYNKDESKPITFVADDFYVVYKELHSTMWDEIMKANRSAPLDNYNGVIKSSQILRFTIKNKAKKSIYIYINDQYPYKYKVDMGTFLNQPTKAMFGGINLAHKFGMGVVYLGMKSVKRGRYEMTFTNICNDASKMTPEDINKEYYRLLEDEIKEQPHNWLWSHKRWK